MPECRSRYKIKSVEKINSIFIVLIYVFIIYIAYIINKNLKRTAFIQNRNVIQILNRKIHRNINLYYNFYQFNIPMLNKK